MPLVIIHPSKEPDGKGKVSLKILFLDGGVQLALQASSSLMLSVLVSVSSSPPSALLHPFLSLKTDQAHRDEAPQDLLGQKFLNF